MDFMEPEDEIAAAQFAASLPPEEQKILQMVSDSFKQMPPEAQGQLRADAHRMMQEHRGNLTQLLGTPLQEEQGPVNKFLPIAIGVIFALDAINTSQGAKRSLVGNVFTDIGNAASEATGGDPNLLGESNYGDMFDYENEVGYVDPISGQRHFVNSDPDMWDRVKVGAVSGAASFINPFAAVGGLGRGAGRVSGAMGRGTSRLVGQGTKKLGQGMQKVPGARWAGGKVSGMADARLANLSRTADDVAMARRLQMAPTGGTGAYGKINRLAGAGGKFPYRTATGLMHTPAGQGAFNQIGDKLGLLFGAGALSQMPDYDVNTTGGYGGQGAFGTAAVGGAAGGFGQGYGMQDITNVTGNVGADKQIWDPHAYRHDPRAQALESGAEFGGFGIGKGENMKIGERMLKEATDRMYKAVCPACGKANCNCKEYKNKNDDDKKKPAHGMVIVIGTKAGPGPSKDGKREKLDSEKDKKEE